MKNPQENATIVICQSFRAIVVFSEGLAGETIEDSFNYVTPLNSSLTRARVLKSNSSVFFVGNATGFKIRITGLSPATQYEVQIIGLICRIESGSLLVIKTLYEEKLEFTTASEIYERAEYPFLLPLLISF